MLCAFKTSREGTQCSKGALQLSWADSYPHKFPCLLACFFTKSLPALASDFPLDSASWAFLNSDSWFSALGSAFGIGPAQTPLFHCTPDPETLFSVWRRLVRPCSLISTWTTQFLSCQGRKCCRLKSGDFECCLPDLLCNCGKASKFSYP